MTHAKQQIQQKNSNSSIDPSEISSHHTLQQLMIEPIKSDNISEHSSPEENSETKNLTLTSHCTKTFHTLNSNQTSSHLHHPSESENNSTYDPDHHSKIDVQQVLPECQVVVSTDKKIVKLINTSSSWNVVSKKINKQINTGYNKYWLVLICGSLVLIVLIVLISVSGQESDEKSAEADLTQWGNTTQKTTTSQPNLISSARPTIPALEKVLESRIVSVAENSTTEQVTTQETTQKPILQNSSISSSKIVTTPSLKTQKDLTINDTIEKVTETTVISSIWPTEKIFSPEENLKGSFLEHNTAITAPENLVFKTTDTSLLDILFNLETTASILELTNEPTQVTTETIDFQNFLTPTPISILPNLTTYEPISDIEGTTNAQILLAETTESLKTKFLHQLSTAAGAEKQPATSTTENEKFDQDLAEFLKLIFTTAAPEPLLEREPTAMSMQDFIDMFMLGELLKEEVSTENLEESIDSQEISTTSSAKIETEAKNNVENTTNPNIKNASLLPAISTTTSTESTSTETPTTSAPKTMVAVTSTTTSPATTRSTTTRPTTTKPTTTRPTTTKPTTTRPTTTRPTTTSNSNPTTTPKTSTLIPTTPTPTTQPTTEKTTTFFYLNNFETTARQNSTNFNPENSLRQTWNQNSANPSSQVPSKTTPSSLVMEDKKSQPSSISTTEFLPQPTEPVKNLNLEPTTVPFLNIFETSAAYSFQENQATTNAEWFIDTTAASHLEGYNNNWGY